MDTVTSADGTTIAYEAAGSGHPIVFVGGAFNDHTRLAPLAGALAGDFTVIGYDRRARGQSGDTRPYAVQREVEDLAAVLDTVGGRAAVFGYSSGGILALLAATTLPVTHLFLYEVPFGLPADPTLAGRLDELIRQDRPGDAVALFQTEGIGLPPQMVAQIRNSPMFPALEAIAQSTVYEATLTSEYAVPTPAMSMVDVPALVLTGADTWPALTAAAKSAPVGRHVEVPGAENHDIPVPETGTIVRDFLTVNNP